MHPSPSTPPLLRAIFVAPSSTLLVHYVTAEWEAMQLRESLRSRRTSETQARLTEQGHGDRDASS